jgi:hypothetical protein
LKYDISNTSYSYLNAVRLEVQFMNTKIRFAALAIALTVCVLAQNPPQAHAAACPSSCSVVLPNCMDSGCLFENLIQVGTCTEDGANHKLYVVHCECFSTECYE